MSVLTVGVSDMKVSSNASDVIVTRALGSCIAVIISDQAVPVGGVLHYQLPALGRAFRSSSPYMYAETGIPALIQAAFAMGADRETLSVKLVGGSRILDPEGVFDIGKSNYLAARKMLWRYGLLVAAEDVGGEMWRNVQLSVGDGSVLVESPVGRYPL